MEADSAFLGCIIAVECRLAVQGLNKLAIVRRVFIKVCLLNLPHYGKETKERDT